MRPPVDSSPAGAQLARAVDVPADERTIHPPYGNLESGDAFCLIKIDIDERSLFFLQSTIAETHSIVARRLEPSA